MTSAASRVVLFVRREVRLLKATQSNYRDVCQDDRVLLTTIIRSWRDNRLSRALFLLVVAETKA
jgi:hypothetical protein